ncbi:beta-glucoside-specific PTS transporter subunit IIABC [[Clostridium] innocuum]|nr:beta-glucoside-specific PTS transporter subunit IIABC [[Clostridium] innocuum]MCR0575661.1 beta-glucoside-specific PTS transporter subunit IIABC [[Clostridium] innocuum]
MKYENLCKSIIKLVGGKENIKSVSHCMTRLRFTLIDNNKADENGIKGLQQVIDVVSNKVSFQIIIGTEVSEIHPELMQMLGDTKSEAEKSDKNLFNRIMNLISESMTPLFPVMMVAGLMAGILSLLTLTGIISSESSTFLIFDTVRVSMFYFFPVFMAMTAAKRLGTNPYLGVLLAVTLLSSTINNAEGLNLFGYGLPTITYSNTFIPILLGLWLMGKTEKIIKKIMPKSLDYFFTYMLVMLIVLPVTLVVFGPIGSWISDGLGFIFDFIGNTFGNWLMLALYAALQPLLIMLGAANFIMPIILNSYTTLGYDPIFTPAFIISDIAVCGTMLGYFLRSKKTEQKQFFAGVTFSAFMGVTEPAVFGAFVKYRRPFIAVMIAGGLGGLVAGILGVKGYAMTTLFGILTFIGQNDYNNLYFMIAAIIVAFVIAVIAGYILWIPKEQEKETEEKVDSKKGQFSLNKEEIAIPVAGKKVALSQIKDRAFSTGALGKGIGIIPSDNIIKAPVTGKIETLFPTNHAIGMKTENGVEVLIHIGIDTVELQGECFQPLIKQGDVVKIGEPLIKVDFKEIEKRGFDNTVIVVITNTQDYLEVIPNLSEPDSTRPELLTVVM